jgi:membrane protein implicated in regulation of membrane protease activity
MSARSIKEEVKQLLGKLSDELTWDELMREMTALKDAHLRSQFEEPSSAPHLEFLYDKRLTLFNTRREHEWKIYFGAMILLGTIDATLVAGHLSLAGWQRWAWVGVCGLILAVVFGYESQLQKRNDADRRAMHELHNRICKFLGISEESPIFERYTDPDQRGIWLRFGWAFPWQIILFTAAAMISALLPFVKTP